MKDAIERVIAELEESKQQATDQSSFVWSLEAAAEAYEDCINRLKAVIAEHETRHTGNASEPE